MIHRMTPASNKRLILLYSTLVLLPLLGVLSFRIFPTIWAFATLAICLLLARGLYRLARPFIRSTIESLDDRLIISVPDHPKVEIPFDTIDLAGEFRIQGIPALFLYGKDQNKLYTFPKEYTGFDMLKELLARRLRFETLPAQNTEELKKLLRDRFG
ncbi:MAG: hypothetical protein N2442_06940 [Spirochaetes bacterium]|nr:hypothetical protein [Spirochaetota bacterium]